MKKSRLILMLLTLVLSLKAQQAQNFEWAIGMRVSGDPNDEGIPRSMVTDASANVYTGGCFYGTIDFDPGPSVYNLTAVGKAMYICKLDSSGNFLWAKTFEPAGGDLSGLAVDQSGNLYATGIGSIGMAVIYKYSPAGVMLWSKSMGGLNSIGFSLAIDASFNIYTTGIFYGSSDFDPGAGTFTLNSAGSADVFILKLNSAGNFVWAKKIGGSIVDLGWDISLDASGKPYITGSFYDTVDFDPGPGTYTLASMSPSSCAFVCKLDTAGNFVWADHFETQGQGGISQAQSIALDSLDNVYIGGSFFNSIDFDPGAGSSPLTSTGDADVFIAKLNPAGNLLWARHMGGINPETLADIHVNPSGIVYSTGTMFGNVADFDPGPAVYNLSSINNDAFISKLDASGNFVWAKVINNGDSFGAGISLDNSGAVYTNGSYNGPGDFDTEAGEYTLTCVGGSGCIFVQKLSIDTASAGNPIGIKPNSLANFISIYPNPAHDVLTIQAVAGENLELQVLDALGQPLTRYNLAGKQQQLNISSLNNGLYFLSVLGNNTVIATQKMVKE